MESDLPPSAPQDVAAMFDLSLKKKKKKKNVLFIQYVTILIDVESESGDGDECGGGEYRECVSSGNGYGYPSL